MASLIRGLFGGGGSSSNTTASHPAANETTPANSNPTSPNRPTQPPSHASSPLRQDDSESSLTLSSPGLRAQGQITLSQLNDQRQLQVKSSNAVLAIFNTDADEFVYEVAVLINNRCSLRQVISSALPTWFDSTDHSIQWAMNIEGKTVLWHAAFKDKDEESTFKWAWQIAIAEQARKELFKKAFDEKQTDWIKHGYDDQDMLTDDESEPKDDDEYEYDARKAVAALSDDDEEDDDDDTITTSKFTKSNAAASSSVTARGPRSKATFAGPRNEQLAVGMNVNRAFVGRGNKLGVFKTDEDGNLEYVNQIKDLKNRKGDSLAPNKLMLTQLDEKMLLLDPNNVNTVYEMDLNRGEIVNEYHGGPEASMKFRDIGARDKYAELTGEQTFLGVNGNTVFSIDPRLNQDDKVAQSKSYAKAYGFNSVATTGDKFVAVGSDKGEIRLYNDITKQAKTALPGLGDAITGIDVTRDGKHLLATTAHYLLLIPTVTDASVSGFTKSITNTAPPPIKLQLKPEDLVHYNITQMHFTAAHFDIGSGAHQEQFIVTSTGNYIVTWNLKKVLRGRKYDYIIKKTISDVVGDQFIYDRTDQVVVALPDDLYIEARKPRTSKGRFSK